MKNYIAAYLLLLSCLPCFSQTNMQAYPEPEFVKEIYSLNKENNSLMRLQKETSQLNTKSKLGGFGGAEYGYTITGERSKVRFSSTHLPSFVFRSREDQTTNAGGLDSMSMMMGNDSMAKMMEGMGSINSMVDDIMDPSKMISLYAMETRKGSRTLLLQSAGGKFGKGKKASNKYTLSFKKIKDGYYEIFVDKMLPRGEYGFVNSAMGSMDATLFVFGVD
jgi:hypothetical protein